MKFRELIGALAALAVVATACCAGGKGPRTMDGKKIDPFIYGVYGVYGDVVAEIADAPEGYEPVYLSHYGRHGSRYILHDTQYVFVAQVLEKADADGILTPKGRELHDRYMSIYPQLEGKTGLLAPLGQQQHREIAKRMYESFPMLFDGRRIVALSTNLQRTKMSMEAFEEELLELCPGLDIDAKVSEEDMYYLNPHSVQNPKVGAKDLHWKSPNAPWREEFNECLRQNVDWRSFGSRIFSDMDRACEICKVENFELDLYFICIHLEGLPIESPGFFDFFTSDELENLAEFGENYILYVRTGRYPKADGRGWALAESLLEDFIVKADRDIEEGEPAVRLRFGHDGCMMSLFALMELDGWNGSESDPTRFREVWDISKVRMAANIQFIFYRNAEGRTIVRMLYNEEDTKLPFPAIEGEEYFYDWEDFKAFYTPRIEAAKKLLEESSI